MKLLAGRVLVACWSYGDARSHEAHSFDEEVDWLKLHRMPSARLFLLRQGDGVCCTDPPSPAPSRPTFTARALSPPRRTVPPLPDVLAPTTPPDAPLTPH